MKLIDELDSINCFTVNKRPSDFIPGGTQALITGNLIDYYTSEGALGKPRIKFEIEIRQANTQALVASKTINISGKLYLGTGNNKPLANVWKQAMDESAIFLYKHLPSIATMTKAVESKETVIDTTLSFQSRVKTKSIYDQQKEYADELRNRDRKRNLSLSDYYNDSLVYKEFPGRPSTQFLQYSINGKKYEFLYTASDTRKMAGFHAFEGTQPTSRHGVRVKIDPGMVSGLVGIDLFYPYYYPKVRWFYFGKDTTHDSRIPASLEKVSFEIYLPGDFKQVSEWSPALKATEQYHFLATNEPAFATKSNIEGGYVQILDFSTGSYGALEAFFKFRTKAYTDEKGKSIPAMNIEGRFRVRGLFPVH